MGPKSGVGFLHKEATMYLIGKIPVKLFFIVN